MKIRIITGGCGIKAPNKKYPSLFLRGDICDVPDAEGKRLIALCVAECVSEGVATLSEAVDASEACSNTPDPVNGTESEESAHLDAEQLRELTNAQLRELAEDMGIDTVKLKTKAQLIAAITDIPLEDAICEEDESVDDGEEPPDLNAEAPVV